MNTLNSLILIFSVVWVLSEIILTFLRRAKDKSKDFDKSNSLILWIINAVSITAGINIAAKGGIGSVSIGYPFIGYLGLLLILSGIVVRWTAIITLGRQFTTTLTIVENHKVIDSGIYKYIRHPSYTGCLMSFLGLSITFSNWLTFIIIFFPILYGYIGRINLEEKLLTDYFGEQYINYIKKTYRLVPKIY